jgi:DNA-binding XRE family transcriptional regulator
MKGTKDENRRLIDMRIDEKGWTKEYLAKQAGVSTQTIRKAERGEAISDVSMARIAKALGVNRRTIFASGRK